MGDHGLPGRISKHEYEVVPIDLKIARIVIMYNHYAHGSPKQCSYSFGLIEKKTGDIVGAAIWLPPTKVAAIHALKLASLPIIQESVVALSRLAVSRNVPKNAASFLLMRGVRRIWKDKNIQLLLTFADDWQGHEGTIYKILGWTFAGKTKPSDKWVTLEGHQISTQAGGKTRTTQEMMALGHRKIGKYSKSRYYLRRGL